MTQVEKIIEDFNNANPDIGAEIKNESYPYTIEFIDRINIEVITYNDSTGIEMEVGAQINPNTLKIVTDVCVEIFNLNATKCRYDTGVCLSDLDDMETYMDDDYDDDDYRDADDIDYSDDDALMRSAYPHGYLDTSYAETFKKATEELSKYPNKYCYTNRVKINLDILRHIAKNIERYEKELSTTTHPERIEFNKINLQESIDDWDKIIAEFNMMKL